MPSAVWLVLVPLLASAAAYWPLTGSFFHADDFLHLYDIADGRAGEFYLTPHAGHLYLARNAVFLLHWWLFGTDPHGYYWTAYLTHLVNVGLLFALIRRATGSARLACLGATIWGVSPLDEGALNWYAVYGHVLLTTCLLGALLLLLRIDDGASRTRRAAPAAVALLLLAALNFGVGIGVAMAMVLAIGLLVPGTAQRGTRRAFRLLPLLLPLLYVGMQVGYAVVAGHRHETASVALTPRELILDVPLMTAYLTAYGTAGLVGGGLTAGLSEPAMLAIGFAVLAAIAALGARRDVSGRRLLACALLVLGGYGIVALGRVPTLAPLGATLAQGASWPRYHYAGTALIALALCLALGRIRLGTAAASAALAAALLVVVGAAIAHPPPVDQHGEERAVVAHLEELVADKISAGAPTAYIHNRNVYPLNYIVDRRTFPGWAGLFVIFHRANIVDGIGMRFIDADPAVVAAARARPGTRSAELLVTREEYRAAVEQ